MLVPFAARKVQDRSFYVLRLTLLIVLFLYAEIGLKTEKTMSYVSPRHENLPKNLMISPVEGETKS